MAKELSPTRMETFMMGNGKMTLFMDMESTPAKMDIRMRDNGAMEKKKEKAAKFGKMEKFT